MASNQSRLTRKALFLLFALGLMAAASAVTPPALACSVLECPFDPPMHWNNILCRCVCDCPGLNGACGNCN
jgi:hypothetical protein